MNRLSSDSCRRLGMFCGILALALILISSAAEAAPWSFAVFGDQRDADGAVGVNTAVIESMAKDIALNRKVSLVLCGGDQIHGHTGATQVSLPTAYQNWRTAMAQILNIAYPVRGNHETYGESHTPYYPYYWDTCIVKVLTQIPQNGPNGEKGMTYSFANQNVLFVGVDQFVPDNDNRVNQPWLDQQLAANILPHVFVYGHEPAVAVNYDLSSLAYYPLQRDAFWESLGNGGCRVYLTGHSHLYNRATVTVTDVHGKTTPPITQLIAGGGGGPLGPWDPQKYYSYQPHAHQPPPPAPESVTATLDNHLEDKYGYAVVTVDGNQVSITYYASKSAHRVPTAWDAYETFGYTVTSKNLGVNDVNQQMDPQILTDYYPGIAINKLGTGTLTLNAGTSPYSGPITVSGGTMRVYGTYASAPVTVNSGGTTALSGGSLNNVAANAGGSLVGNGMVVGSLTNSGEVSPGLSSGPWNLGVTGDYAQSATGTLTVNIASATDYGQLQVTGSPGAANLNGVVSVALQNDYEPVAHQVFPNIITASGSLTGRFSQIIVTPATSKFNWLPVYTANSFGLKAVPKSLAPQLELLLSWADLHLLPTMARIN